MQGGKNRSLPNRSMQTGSSGTLIGWKSGQTTFVPVWDRMEGAWLRTQKQLPVSLQTVSPLMHTPRSPDPPAPISCPEPFAMSGNFYPQSIYRGRVEMGGGGVSALSAGAYTLQLCTDGRYGEREWAYNPQSNQTGLIFPSWWKVRQKVAIACLVYVYNVLAPTFPVFFKIVPG
jgi:hypothetical protein